MGFTAVTARMPSGNKVSLENPDQEEDFGGRQGVHSTFQGATN